MRKQMVLTGLIAMLVMSGCAASKDKEKPAEITISAAASLKNVLTELEKNFSNENPHINVSFNFGGSGTLKQQISQGAPADLFFSAAEEPFDQLKKEGLIDEKHETDLIGNEIVLITSKDKKSIRSFQDIQNVEGAVAIGSPDSVPAGRYAKESLEHLGKWKKLSGKMVYGKDVRQVLNYVETGNADAGIVYRTDAAASKKVRIASAAPEGSHSPIVYPLGIMKQTSHPKEAAAFYTFLNSSKAAKTFEKYGFTKVSAK